MGSNHRRPKNPLRVLPIRGYASRRTMHVTVFGAEKLERRTLASDQFGDALDGRVILVRCRRRPQELQHLRLHHGATAKPVPLELQDLDATIHRFCRNCSYLAFTNGGEVVAMMTLGLTWVKKENVV